MGFYTDVLQVYRRATIVTKLYPNVLRQVASPFDKGFTSKNHSNVILATLVSSFVFAVYSQR